MFDKAMNMPFYVGICENFIRLKVWRCGKLTSLFFKQEQESRSKI